MNSTDLFRDFEFLSQAQLADVFGTTSVTIGRSLVRMGLRTAGGIPTPKALNYGIVQMVATDNKQFPAWKKDITIELLERVGHRRSDSIGSTRLPVTDNCITLRGPFTIQPCGETHGAIVNGDGTCYLWGIGRANLDAVVTLLGLADKHGKLAPSP